MLISGPLPDGAPPGDRLSRGEAVPGGPGACARRGCAHSKPWHTPASPRRACERCACPGYSRVPCPAPQVQGVLF
jgi:hypothetical protein